MLVTSYGIAWLVTLTSVMVGMVPKPIDFLISVEAAGGAVGCKEKAIYTLMKLRDFPVPHVVPAHTGSFVVPERHGMFVGDAPFWISTGSETISSSPHGDYEHHLAWDTFTRPTRAMVSLHNRRVVYVPTDGMHYCQ